MLLESIKTAQSEKVIREYSFSSVGSNIEMIDEKKRFKKGTASVCVTNRRLICRVQGKTGTIGGSTTASLYQMNIKNVGDIRICVFKRSKLLPLLLIIIGILLCVTIIGALIGVFLVIIGIVLWVSRSPLKSLDVKSMGGSGQTNAGFTVFAERKLIEGNRGFEKMTVEISALISDIQTYGDDCILNWVHSIE